MVGLAVRTPPYPVLLTNIPHAAVSALAAPHPGLPGVAGLVGLARRFATWWAGLTGGYVAPAEAGQLFRLHQLTRPS